MAPNKIQRKLIGELHREHPCCFKRGEVVNGQSSNQFYNFAVQEMSESILQVHQPELEFLVKCIGCEIFFCLPALREHLLG